MKLKSQKPIVTIYDAVSLSKGLDVLNGSLRQNYYAESGVYIPDRSITPLVLRPNIFISDPNKVIDPGNKVDDLSRLEWFKNGVKIISDDNFTIKGKELRVYLNSEEPFEIAYRAEWLDPRKKQIIVVEDSVLVSCISMAESDGNPTMSLDKPQNWRHNPLKGERIYDVVAEVFLNGEKQASQPVEWYADGVKISENDYFYIAGQGTQTLQVDSDYMYDMVISARLGKLEESAKFLRKYPSSLYLDHIMPTRLKEGITKVKAIAQLGHADGLVDNPSEFFFLAWTKRAATAGAAELPIGYGNEVEVDVKDKEAISVEATDLGHFKALKTEDDFILTDDDGLILTTR